MWPNNSNTSDYRHEYESISSWSSSDTERYGTRSAAKRNRTIYVLITALLMLLSAALGFLASTLYYNHNQQQQYSTHISSTPGIKPRVELNTITRVFEHDSDFTLPPPTGPNSGNESEPIWDSLIPKGLGYISHPSLPTTSIPTVFHQLHCLYTIRRAYFANLDLQSSSSQRFDLGKPRTYHVSHCFDFLQQGLTCSADSTLEPAIDKENEFLGAGFQRQCRDYEGLKTFVEKYRVFESQGFLAEGMDIHSHGHDHPDERHRHATDE